MNQPDTIRTADVRAPLQCHVHPRYKAIRKPRPGCVLCHAMWQEKLVRDERAKKTGA